MKTLKAEVQKAVAKKDEISKARVKTLQALGYSIVAAETDTSTVAEALMAVLGLSDKELVLVADSMSKRWDEVYAEIKAPVGGKRGKHILGISQRTAYNRRSDDKAWINACRSYALKEAPVKMKHSEFKTQCERVMKSATGDKRNALVMLARAYVSKNAGKGSNENVAGQRAASAWKNKPSETFSKLKVMLSHAPLAWCFKLEAMIEKRIAEVKKQPLAEVKALRKAA